LIFGHLSPGLIKSLANSPPTHPPAQSQENSFVLQDLLLTL